MKLHFAALLLVFGVLFISCDNHQTQPIQTKADSLRLDSLAKIEKQKQDSIDLIQTLKSLPNLPESTENLGYFYVVVADTGLQFDTLQQRLHIFHEVSKIAKSGESVVFDIDKGLVFPQDSDDEMYAGDYLPRRYTSDYLSIERLNAYEKQYDESKKTMALVAGLYTEKEPAAVRLQLTRKYFPHAFILNSELYVGCAH